MKLFEPRPTFFDRANCKGKDPNIFFPRVGENAPAEAKQLCRECVVLDECYEFVLTAPRNELGYWAGMSEKERRGLRRLRGVRDTIQRECQQCDVTFDAPGGSNGLYCKPCGVQRHREKTAAAERIRRVEEVA